MNFIGMGREPSGSKVYAPDREIKMSRLNMSKTNLASMEYVRIK